MVKINERFEIEKDSLSWLLHEWRKGINPRTKEPTLNKGTTYYSDLIQVCNAIIDRSCDQADNVHTIMDCIDNARQDVLRALGCYKFDKDAFGCKMNDILEQGGK